MLPVSQILILLILKHRHYITFYVNDVITNPKAFL